jgi:hypothetical protein
MVKLFCASLAAGLRRAGGARGATGVNPARAILFVVAALAGVGAAYLLSGAPGSGALLPFGNPHTQDWILWIVGLWLLTYCLYSVVRRRAALDWRWPIWLIVGSTMIYTEWFDVAPLKEVACRVLQSRHHPASPGPCYKRTEPGAS